MFQKLKAIFDIPDLRRKLLLTVVLLGVYRMGFWIPLPVVNQELMQSNLEKLEQGQLMVPAKPGLGLAFDQSALKRYQVG